MKCLCRVLLLILLSVLSTVALAQPAAETVSWGPAVGGLQIGWEPTKTSVTTTEPLILMVRIRAVPNGPPVSIELGRTLFFYDVQVFSVENHMPANLTGKGLEELDPNRTVGSGGVDLDPGMTKRDEIRLSEWWDLSKPGSYTVSIARAQPGRNGKKPEVLHAPDVAFNVLP